MGRVLLMSAEIPGLGTVLAWQPSPQSPFWRAVWPDRIPVEKFRRVWPEPAQIDVAPHPAPEVPARLAEPGEWPTQRASVLAVRLPDWEIVRSTFARGTDMDPKSGDPLGVVDSYALVLEWLGDRVIVTWRRGDEMLCRGCATPRKPTVAGLVRVHAGCDGGGQTALASGERGAWEFSCAWGTGGRVFPGITAVIDYVKGQT